MCADSLLVFCGRLGVAIVWLGIDIGDAIELSETDEDMPSNGTES